MLAHNTLTAHIENSPAQKHKTLVTLLTYLSLPVSTTQSGTSRRRRLPVQDSRPPPRHRTHDHSSTPVLHPSTAPSRQALGKRQGKHSSIKRQGPRAASL